MNPSTAQPALGSTERTNQLLQEASKQTGIAAQTFPVAKPAINNIATNTQMPEGVDFGTSLKSKTSYPSTSLAGGISPKDLFARQSELQQAFVKASQPSSLETDLTSQLTQAKDLSRKAQLEFMDERRRLEETGALTKAQSTQFISETGRRYADTFARQGIGMSGLADALTAEVGKRTTSMDGLKTQMQFSKDNLDLLKDLQAMTKPDVLSTNVNEYTGEVVAFMQDPQTGAITQTVMGNVGVGKKYIQTGTRVDENGNDVFWGITPDGTIESQILGKGEAGADSKFQSVVIDGKAYSFDPATGNYSPASINGINDVPYEPTGDPVEDLTNFFKENEAKLSDKESAALGVLVGVNDFANNNANGEFAGLGATGIFDNRWMTEKGTNNRQSVAAIELAVQQWASGASLTEDQTKKVMDMVPKKTDTDRQIKNKINGLSDYMLGQIRTAAIKAGVTLPVDSIDYKFDGTTNKVDPILKEYKNLWNQASPEQQEAIGGVSVVIPKNTLAYRNNNPGNLRFADQAGAVKGEKGFAKFATPYDGVMALANQIKLDITRNHTLQSFVAKYAPPSENNTKAYLSKVASMVNAEPNTPLARVNLKSLVSAIAKLESSTKIG